MSITNGGLRRDTRVASHRFDSVKGQLPASVSTSVPPIQPASTGESLWSSIFYCHRAAQRKAGEKGKLNTNRPLSVLRLSSLSGSAPGKGAGLTSRPPSSPKPNQTIPSHTIPSPTHTCLSARLLLNQIGPRSIQSRLALALALALAPLAGTIVACARCSRF